MAHRHNSIQCSIWIGSGLLHPGTRKLYGLYLHIRGMDSCNLLSGMQIKKQILMEEQQPKYLHWALGRLAGHLKAKEPCAPWNMDLCCTMCVCLLCLIPQFWPLPATFSSLSTGATLGLLHRGAQEFSLRLVPPGKFSLGLF